jgi:hypothetical protein
MPPRDVRVREASTGTITGIVVADDSEARPVRHARVTLGSSEPAIGLTTITGDNGQFTFERLPAGRFNISVVKEGWLPIAYGAKRPQGPGTPVRLANGEAARIVMRLPRGGVVTGTVFDSGGQPAIGATVRALYYSTVDGERRLNPTGSLAVADDRGVYRIYGLPPRDYVIAATWRPAYFGTGGRELHLTSEVDVRDALSASSASPPAPQPIALASTFYPGTTMVRQAALVTIRGAEERAGVDFALQIVPTARVEGTISLPGASAPPGAVVTLIANDQSAIPGERFDTYRTGGIQADGSFTFSDIVPGEYTVFAYTKDASASGSAQTLWASTNIVVAGETLTGLNLLLAPGNTLSGQLQFDSQTLKPPADLKSVRITLLPVETTGGATLSPAGAAIDSAGRFTMSGILPGRYTLTASFPGLGAPGGWALGSALVNGIDALDVPFKVVPNSEGPKAVIRFVDWMGQLTGALHNASGTPAPEYSIVLFPTSPALWFSRARRIQSVRPSADGSFIVRNLPAGEYYLTALEDVEPAGLFDPAFLQELISSSMRLAIGEGEHKVQNIRLAR